jgi:hypothetical protein
MNGAGIAGRYRTAIAVSCGAVALFVAPFLIHQSRSGKPYVDVSKPLKPEAARRGAFNNSGSRDLGPEYALCSIPGGLPSRTLHTSFTNSVSSYGYYR